MRILRLAQLVLSVMLSAGIFITAISPGASAAQGDPAAKAAIVAAFQRLNALPSFRMKSTSIEDGGKVVVEFVRPDKVHVTFQSPQYTYEGIAVGKQSASRTTAPNEAPGWRCIPGSLPVAGDFFNIDGIRRDLEVAPAVRKPDTMIDKTPVHAYGDSSGKTTLYVGAQTGLPRRLVDTNRETGKTGSFDFYDYGVRITITMPPCK